MVDEVILVFFLARKVTVLFVDSNVFGMTENSGVWWTASDVGWVVGHSYITYAPLLHGNTTVLFEGFANKAAACR